MAKLKWTHEFQYLLVRPWIFRAEIYFLAADLKNDPGPDGRNEPGSVAEIRAYLATGMDGFFTDDPGLGVPAAGL